jgi:hypothetical protein
MASLDMCTLVVGEQPEGYDVGPEQQGPTTTR